MIESAASLTPISPAWKGEGSHTPPRRASPIRKILPLILLVTILLTLLLDRTHYLLHFGTQYTDADQTIFWYQADDIAHGIFREPCVYGQSYNFPLESWLAAPLLLCQIPPYIALPLATTLLGLLPFLALSFFAYKKNHKFPAALILLIPLILPVEYSAVSSIPRGFINGLAVATPTLICWLFYRSKKSFFFAAFFATLALTTNLNSSILLLALGIYALLTNFFNWRFYLFTFLGTLAAAPAPLLINLFYKYHPECNAYRPYLPFTFDWNLLKRTLFDSGHLNYPSFNLFFNHFIPGTNHGWFVLLILPLLIVMLLLVRRFKVAVALFLASAFMFLCLGIERVHMAHPDVFYPGSRMFLALPLLIAIALLFFDIGLITTLKKSRAIPLTLRVLLFLSLSLLLLLKNYPSLNFPSPLLENANVPPIEDTATLLNDSHALADACAKYHADLVLISGQPWDAQCMNDAGPLLSHHAFQTLYPPFERRTWLIAKERTNLHTTAILYLPSFMQSYNAQKAFPNSKIISTKPRLLLIQVAPPGLPGMEIVDKLGIPYLPTF